MHIFICRGESLAHVIVLEPKVKQAFYGPPAVVTYRMATKSVLQVLFVFSFVSFLAATRILVS